MKIQENRDEFFVSNSDDATAFGMNTNSYVYDVLSNGIYSDKVSAVIREVSCNAVDSHIVAGIPDIPIRVTLPTATHQFFEVEDFGIGMDDDTVRTVFGSYFNSTKTAANDTTGAFGLGSKTPFIMNDAFTVRVRYDSVERVYSCFKKDGVPSISLSSSNPTEHGNGVKVTVPVSPTLCGEFSRKAVKIYRFFKVLPDVVDNGHDAELYTVPTTVGDVTFDANEISYNDYAIVTAVMGGVSYPVNLANDIPDSNKHFKDIQLFLSVYYGSRITDCKRPIIEFPIGDLSVTPSRESLSLDERTVENIASGISAFVNKKREGLKAIMSQGYTQPQIIDAVIEYIVPKIGQGGKPPILDWSVGCIMGDICNIMDYFGLPLNKYIDFGRYSFKRHLGFGVKKSTSVVFIGRRKGSIFKDRFYTSKLCFDFLQSYGLSREGDETIEDVVKRCVNVIIVSQEKRVTNTGGIVTYCHQRAKESDATLVIVVPHRMTDKRQHMVEHALLDVFGIPAENIKFEIFRREVVKKTQTAAPVVVKEAPANSPKVYAREYEYSSFGGGFGGNNIFYGDIGREWIDGNHECILYIDDRYEDIKTSWKDEPKLYLLNAARGFNHKVVIRHRNNAKGINAQGVKSFDDMYEQYVTSDVTKHFIAYVMTQGLYFGCFAMTMWRYLHEADEPILGDVLEQIKAILAKYEIDIADINKGDANYDINYWTSFGFDAILPATVCEDFDALKTLNRDIRDYMLERYSFVNVRCNDDIKSFVQAAVRGLIGTDFYSDKYKI